MGYQIEICDRWWVPSCVLHHVHGHPLHEQAKAQSNDDAKVSSSQKSEKRQGKRERQQKQEVAIGFQTEIEKQKQRETSLKRHL